MTRATRRSTIAAPAGDAAFRRARAFGLALPGVEEVVRYDGAPGLTRDGRFMAAAAGHASAEPATLVVRATPDARDALIAEAPDTYYLTDHYARHPVVLARLCSLTDEALQDLLASSWRLSAPRRRAPLDP